MSLIIPPAEPFYFRFDAAHAFIQRVSQLPGTTR
jgi:hypothetical protein